MTIDFPRLHNFKRYSTAVCVGSLLFAGTCVMASTLPDPLEAGWNGASICEVLHEDDHQRALRCTVAPGDGHERHFHDRHFGYVIAGGPMRISDESGTREVNLETGSSFANEAIDWHEVINIGDSTAIFLIVEPK